MTYLINVRSYVLHRDLKSPNFTTNWSTLNSF